MSESSSTLVNPSSSGIQGLAMMAPVVGFPIGLHALTGAFIITAGIIPIAVPLALPLLLTLGSKSDLNSLAEKFFSPPRSSAAESQVVAVPVRVADKVAEPASSITVETGA
jgi:hypothetical protein